jgi:hypothetical protein
MIIARTAQAIQIPSDGFCFCDIPEKVGGFAAKAGFSGLNKDSAIINSAEREKDREKRANNAARQSSPAIEDVAETEGDTQGTTNNQGNKCSTGGRFFPQHTYEKNRGQRRRKKGDDRLKEIKKILAHR